MDFSFLKSGSKKTILGVDIGSKNTKILGLKSNKNNFTVSHFSMTPTPSVAFSNGKITDPSKLSDFISNQLLTLDISNNIELILGISGKGMIAKKIDIPKMEEYMIAEYVEIEAEQELFYNKDEMHLDYQILENLNLEKSESIPLFVMTIVKQITESYISAVPEDIAYCDIIDTNFSALYNICLYNMNLNPESIYMIIDSGCSMTNVIIVIQNQIVFARNLPFGGDFFTEKIQKKMSVDYPTAENLKIVAGQNTKETPAEVASFIKSDGCCGTFVEELVSCYQLYLSFYPDKHLNQIYVTGGNSQTLGLKETIESKFSLKVQSLEAFTKIKANPDFLEEGSSLFYSVVAGLALRGMQ